MSQVAELVDAGVLQTTETRTLSPIDAANLKETHRIAESGTAIGKTTLVSFSPVPPPRFSLTAKEPPA